MIDITPLVNAVLGILATLITAYLIPWLKAKAAESKSNMTENQLYFYKLLAGIAVDAAQQIYCDNKQKLEYALKTFEKLCEQHSLHYDSAMSRAYIEDAVKALKGFDVVV